MYMSWKFGMLLGLWGALCLLAHARNTYSNRKRIPKLKIVTQSARRVVGTTCIAIFILSLSLVYSPAILPPQFHVDIGPLLKQIP